MSKIPQQLQYTKTHEWVRKEGDYLVFGITDHAQAMLGDVVYVDLPDVEMSFDKEEGCAVVESVKAAADIYCPVSAEIIEVNQDVIDHPQLINQDPYGQGWLMRVRPFEQARENLLNAAEYTKIVAAEAH